MNARAWLSLLLLSSCGAPSASDSGIVGDAGLTDAGNPGSDAGVADAGSADAGVADAGAPDAGVDAGPPPRLFVFTGSSNGQIRAFAFSDGGLTALGSTNAGTGAGFLAVDVARGRLYATNEGSNQIAAFTLNTADAGLTFLNRVASGGNGPAHVSVDATGRFVFAANYGGGTVAVLPVRDGGLSPPTQTLASGGQAHQILTDPGNRFAWVPCKAADHLAQYAFDAGTLTKLTPAAMSTATGAGPRHLALHPTLPRAYLINELGSTLQTLAIAANGTMTPVQTVSTLPSGFMGANTCAEVAVHPNGRFVFGSNRGHDSLVTWSVDDVTGQLTLVGHTPTGGQTPRHFSLDPSGAWLIVGNQNSNSVALFQVNASTGALSSRGTVATVTTPSYVGFVELP